MMNSAAFDTSNGFTSRGSSSAKPGWTIIAEMATGPVVAMN
jgi:hypothetical protein